MDNRNPGGMTRRTVLGVGGAGLLTAASITACDTSTEPATPAESDEQALESPTLTELIEQGELPPLEDRLPANPMVVEPVERAGRYGGTWHSALLGPTDTAWLGRTIGYEPLVRWTPDWSGTVPNVAESVDLSDDGREYTITLREGMKWSDGTPFTTDDIVFAYEDVISNEEVSPVFPSWLLSGGEPGKLDQVDDLVVRLTFAEPFGLLSTWIAVNSNGSALINRPRHYLEQFHVDYGTDVEAMAEEEGYATWAELFAAKSSPWENADLPTLFGWRITTALGIGSRVVAERNPFYWKTDPDGRQLPYIDEIIYDVVSDDEVMLLKATNGEMDFHTRHINSTSNKPVLAESREAGDYDFVALAPNYTENEMVIALNLVHRDPVKRELFQNKDFRIGLSHAINRPEMIDAAFQRQGEPYQAAPIPASEFYDEEFATQYLEYDVDLANEHLDRAGLTERDGSGFRLGSDGKRISIDVEIALPTFIAFWPDAMDLVVGYWAEVGIRAQSKTEDRSLFYERKEANEHDANLWIGGGNDLFDPRWYFPFSGESNWATPWAGWFTSRGETESELVEEPPEAPRRQMELYWELMAAPEEEQRNELLRQIMQIAKEEFYVIGTVYLAENYGFKKNNFHNVPEQIPDSWIFSTPAPVNPEQFFIE